MTLTMPSVRETAQDHVEWTPNSIWSWNGQCAGILDPFQFSEKAISAKLPRGYLGLSWEMGWGGGAEAAVPVI